MSEFEFQRGSGETRLNPYEAICQAIGAASVCWSDPPSGVFQSERALQIAMALYKELAWPHTWMVVQ